MSSGDDDAASEDPWADLVALNTRTKAPAKSDPWALAVARFHRTYPGMMVGPHWPTRDRVIPHALFQVLMHARRHVIAEERAAMTHAVGIAIGQAMSPDSDQVKSAARAQLREAFPEE